MKAKLKETDYCLGDIGLKKVFVISDIHAGDPRVSSFDLFDLYRKASLQGGDYLILAGDIYEEIYTCPLDYVYLFELMLCFERVFILPGNHDRYYPLEVDIDFSLDAGSYMGRRIKFSNNISFLSNGRSFVVEHGHRFDSAWNGITFFSKAAIYFNRCFYKAFGVDLQSFFRKFSFVRKKLKSQHNAVMGYWHDLGFDVAISGHTHIPTCIEGYANSGDWVKSKSFLTIKNGNVRLWKW